MRERKAICGILAVMMLVLSANSLSCEPRMQQLLLDLRREKQNIDASLTIIETERLKISNAREFKTVSSESGWMAW